jgi:hypothetical protein
MARYKIGPQKIYVLIFETVDRESVQTVRKVYPTAYPSRDILNIGIPLEWNLRQIRSRVHF